MAYFYCTDCQSGNQITIDKFKKIGEYDGDSWYIEVTVFRCGNCQKLHYDIDYLEKCTKI